MNIASRTQQYVAIRDMIREVEKRHKAELAEPKELLAKIAGEIEGFLSENGLDNLKTPYGTCYKSMKHSASLADPKAFMDYVIQSERWDLLDKKANVTAVRTMLANTNELPPGVNLSSVASIRVKRGDGAKDDED